jgi:predicted nucleotidyltransferase
MLATLLGSETRARVLAILLADLHRDYHLRELIRLVGGGASGVQREVERLVGLGLVESEYTAEGRRLLRVVDGHELLEPLRALLAADAAGAAPPGVPVGAANPDDSEPQVHALLRPRLPAVLAVLREAGARRAIVFGSAALADGRKAPRDLDIVVRLGGPTRGRAARYFALRSALEQASRMPVDLIEDDAVDNPYLRAEIERTGVTLVAAA